MSVSACGLAGPGRHCNAAGSRRWRPAAKVRAPQSPGSARIPGYLRGWRRTRATRIDSADRNQIVLAQRLPPVVHGGSGAGYCPCRNRSCPLAGTHGPLDAAAYRHAEQRPGKYCCNRSSRASVPRQCSLVRMRCKCLFVRLFSTACLPEHPAYLAPTEQAGRSAQPGSSGLLAQIRDQRSGSDCAPHGLPIRSRYRYSGCSTPQPRRQTSLVDRVV